MEITTTPVLTTPRYKCIIDTLKEKYMAISITDYDGFRIKGDEQVKKFTEQFNCEIVRTENRIYNAAWSPMRDDMYPDVKTLISDEYTLRIGAPDLLRLMADRIRFSTTELPGHSHSYPSHNPHSHSYTYNDQIAEIERRYEWSNVPNASFVILDLINESLERKKKQLKEEEIRNKNAAVKIAWEQYQLLLAMCKDD